MNSISNTDLAVIDFLIRNFSELFTIRQIAIKLKLSPAGVHKSLKKLEADSILKSEKLGSGLFFRINFESRIAKHLCAIALLEKKPSIDFKEAVHYVKLCISDGKTAVIVSHDTEKIRQSLPKNQISYTVLTHEEFMESILKRDKKMLAIIKNGKMVVGEDVLIETLKRGAFRI